MFNFDNDDNISGEYLCLYKYHPEKDIHYNLRQRSHSLTLPSEDNNLIRKNFLHRMLFRDIY